MLPSAPAALLPHRCAPRRLIVALLASATLTTGGLVVSLRDSVGGRAVPAPGAGVLAHASGWIPRDPGLGGTRGGWRATQWNFAGRYGVNGPRAWKHLRRAGRPGGRGTVVAILDTGVAYSRHGRHRRSPDFGVHDFARGYDFVDHDRFPDDENGHGTHVAGTIGERTDNAVGVTGLAFGARLMPVRVLSRNGSGESAAIAAGIRYAARHGADVINLSFGFPDGTTAGEIPDVLAALRYAHRRGVLVVASSGNSGRSELSYPARAPDVVSVGATTEHGCLAAYSNTGPTLDIVAPGGGPDAALAGDPRCRPHASRGRDIVQVTFGASLRSFGVPVPYVGTSMAAPHVSATAALVIASGVLGRHPAPLAIQERLQATARPLGPRPAYGAGLVDAAAATNPNR